jgi:hypothetical protein
MGFNQKFNKSIYMRMLLILLGGSLVANLILLYGFFEMRKEVFNQYKYNLSAINQVQFKNHR